MSNVAQLRTGKPTARDMLAGIKVIDVDTHVTEWPDLWTSRAPARLKNLVPRQVGQREEKRWVIGEDTFIHKRNASSAVMRDGSKAAGYRFAETEIDGVSEAAWNVDARVRMMDEQGIFAQIAYPNVLGFGGHRAMNVDEELRVASIEIFNDAMADMQKQSAGRIYPMALLPWWDVDLSIKEIERCMKMGLRGVNINSDPHDHGLPSLGEKHWYPLWDCCVANDLPVNFHIGASDASLSWFSDAAWPERKDVEKLALGGVMLFITNFKVMGNILLSRFLEDHPKLKMVSVESGAGWIPYLLEALQYMSNEAGVQYKVAPREVFRRQIYACTFFERENLIDTVRQVGADNIMFESDFPHPACLYPDALEYLADAIAELTVEERFKIFSGNAAKVYHIDIG
jgi:predicted TIM-barrel fold metal-dependent hydrolase